METGPNKDRSSHFPTFTHKMDVTSRRRATSAGYRFTDRTRELTARSAESRQPAPNRGQDPGEAQAPDKVKQDQLWRDAVFKERRLAREW